MRHALRAASIIGAVVLLAGLSACTAGTPTAAHTTDAGPDAVSVSVYQPRPDVAAGRMAIQVHNDAAEPLVIEKAELTSSYFQDDLVWSPGREARVLPGRALDLRVQVAGSDCTQPNTPEHLVTLRYRFGEGAPRTATFVPTDEFDVLELLHDAACLTERVAEVATVTARSVTVPGQPGIPATLTIAVAPTGAAGTVVVDAVTSTTLLAAFDGTSGVGELALGVTIDAAGPREITLALVPNRCDPHALAEDKVGTRIPLQVTAPDGTKGRLVLSASDELRGQMYAFYSSFCGLG